MQGAGRAVDSEPYTVLESVVTQIRSTVDPRLSEPPWAERKILGSDKWKIQISEMC